MTNSTNTILAATTPRRRRTSFLLGGALALALSTGALLPGTGMASPVVPDTAIPPAHAVGAGPSIAASRKPENGTVLARRGSGSGRFTVVNTGNDTDAVVTMSTRNRAVLVMYVRAGATATATKVPDGTFDVFVERGQEWNSASGRFDRPGAVGKFDRQASFTSSRTSRGTTYSRITATLHTVPGGNARVVPVASDSVPS